MPSGTPRPGMVVMRHQDRECLRELCEWIGWRVVEGVASKAEDKMAAGH